jgi:hypothetical protein
VAVVVLEEREKTQNQMAFSLRRSLVLQEQPQWAEKAEKESLFLGLLQQLQLH